MSAVELGELISISLEDNRRGENSCSLTSCTQQETKINECSSWAFILSNGLNLYLSHGI